MIYRTLQPERSSTMNASNPCSSYRMFGNKPEDADRYITELVAKALEANAIEISIKPVVLVDFTRPNLGTTVHNLTNEITGKKPTRIKFSSKKRQPTEEEFDKLMIVEAMASMQDSDAIYEHERLMSWSTDLLADYLISKLGTKKHGPRHWSGSFEQEIDDRKILVEFEVVGTKKKDNLNELTRHINLNIILAAEDGAFPNSLGLVKAEVQRQAKEKGIDLSDIDLDHQDKSILDLLLKIMNKFELVRDSEGTEHELIPIPEKD